MFGSYRLMLACFVALSHFGFVFLGFNPGQWAVVSFYILSGYLMSSQILKFSNSRLFYIDRLLRIYPLFLAVLLLASLLDRATVTTVLVNSLLLPLDYDIFTGVPTVIKPSWSLACEAHFYLLVPLLTAASTRVLRLIVIGSVGLFTISVWLPWPAFWSFSALPGILFTFIAGILIFRKDVNFVKILWMIMLLLFLGFIYTKHMNKTLPTGIHINVCLGYLIGLPIIFRLSQFSPKVSWDQWLGLLSFPLFLVHEPVGKCINYFWGHVPYGLLLAFSTIASLVLVVLIEKPMDRFRYKIRDMPTRTKS